VNGEAIYGTRPWHVFGEGPTEVPEGAFTDTDRAGFTAEDIRFTQKDNALYAICLAWPGQEAHIRSLSQNAEPHGIESVELLGCTDPLAWRQDEAGLHISLPSEQPCRSAFAFKIRLRE
jgi:alpha-L-fucosidase